MAEIAGKESPSISTKCAKLKSGGGQKSRGKKKKQSNNGSERFEKTDGRGGGEKDEESCSSGSSWLPFYGQLEVVVGVRPARGKKKREKVKGGTNERMGASSWWWGRKIAALFPRLGRGLEGSKTDMEPTRPREAGES